MQAICPQTYTTSKIIYNCPQKKTQITLLTSLSNSPVIAKTSFNSLTHEYEIQSQLSHNYLLHSHSMLSTTQQQTIILDYCEHGDLADIITRYNQLPLDFTRGILTMIIEGLSYMHSQNLCHRDIKPQNILLNQDGFVKICDFAETKEIDQEMRNVVGTKAFMAPEVIQNSICYIKYPYDGKFVDIFSLGVVLFWMVFRTYPFQCALPRDKMYKMLFNKEFDQFWSIILAETTVNLPKPDELKEIQELLQMMLKWNANQRPLLKDILKSKFMSRKTMSPKEIAGFLTNQK